METLTLDRAKELAKAVVAEFGEDYLYPDEHRMGDGACRYVYDEKPSCLVAQILHRHGVPVQELSKHEHVSASVMVVHVTSVEDYQPTSFLDFLQHKQDRRATWGEALKYALDAHKG